MIDKDMSLDWQTSDSIDQDYAPDFGEVVGSCDLLDALVERIFDDGKNRLAYKKMIGSIYARILEEKKSVSARKILAIVDERINEHGRERVRMVYIYSALTTVLIVGICLLISLTCQSYLLQYGLDSLRRLVISCSLLGGIGAFITTFARFQNYKGSLVAGINIHRLDGFLRIFYGLIAGLVIILAIKANVLVGFSNESKSSIPWLYYFLSVIAGASEILIPNLIKQTEGNSGSKEGKQKEDENKSKDEQAKLSGEAEANEIGNEEK